MVWYPSPEDLDDPVPREPLIAVDLLPTPMDYAIDIASGATSEADDMTALYGRLTPRMPWEPKP